MLSWIKKFFYNRKIARAIESGQKIKLDHDLINDTNKRRIEKLNIEHYRAQYSGLADYDLFYEDYIRLAGPRHYTYNGKLLVKEGEQLMFFQEPDNPYGNHTVLVTNLGGQAIAHIPTTESAAIYDGLEMDYYYEAFVALIDLHEPAFPQIDVDIKVFRPKK